MLQKYFHIFPEYPFAALLWWQNQIYLDNSGRMELLDLWTRVPVLGLRVRRQMHPNYKPKLDVARKVMKTSKPTENAMHGWTDAKGLSTRAVQPYELSCTSQWRSRDLIASTHVTTAHGSGALRRMEIIPQSLEDSHAATKFRCPPADHSVAESTQA